MSLTFKRWKLGLKSFSIVSVVVLIFHFIPDLKRYADQMEQITLDMRYRNFNSINSPSKQIILIDLDEESLRKYKDVYGRWPWPRRAQKEIVSYISEGQPSMVLYDVLFSEPQKEGDDDHQLAEVSASYKNVSHAALPLPESGLEGVDFIKLPSDRPFPNPVYWRIPPEKWFDDNRFKSIALPTQEIWNKTHFVHSVNVDPDQDGILRRVPLIIHYDGQWIPSLALRGILSQSFKNPTKLLLNDQHLEIYESDKVLKHRIPIDESGNLFLHYYTNSLAFHTIPISAILDSAIAKEEGKFEEITIDPEIFKDKIVVVGTSAMGLEDLKVTPIGKQYPGVLLHTTAISNVLQNDYLKEFAPNTPLWMTLGLVFFCYFSIFFVDSFFIRNIFPPLSLFTSAFVSVYFFKDQSLHLPMALPLIAAGGLTSWLFAFRNC